MLLRALRRLGQFLLEHQDPRYRNAPFVLPNAWHGHGTALDEEEVKRLNLNVRDIGLDPVAVSQQPHNQMLLAVTRCARKQKSK